jgi:hypothetical protein
MLAILHAHTQRQRIALNVQMQGLCQKKMCFCARKIFGAVSVLRRCFVQNGYTMVAAVLVDGVEGAEREATRDRCELVAHADSVGAEAFGENPPHCRHER